MATSPTVRRRRLARELARLREAAGLTIEQAAEAAGISMSHLSRVERAQVGIRLPAVKVLLSVYDADPETRAYLIGIAKDATQRGWWHKYAGWIPLHYATFIGFEAEADQMWNYEPMAVPGLLQTEAYARAMFHAGASRLTDEEIAKRVEVRLQRQEILRRSEPPRFWFILDEAVVRRQVGGPGVHADQLDHLVEVAKLPHVDIQVLPFTLGAHAGAPGSLVVLQFSEPTDPPVVYLETMVGDLYPEGEDEVEGAILAFDRLRATALSPDQSVALIQQAAKELR